MTEQIKSAIRTFNQLLFLKKVDLPMEEIERNIETAIECLEKQIPKKAIDYKCPACKEEFCTESWEVDYCCRCGQRLKWEVDNEQDCAD